MHEIPTTKRLSLEDRLPMGTVLDGKYRLERIIGSGGMGIVIAARHLAMGNVIAIKFLRLEDENDPASAVTRFVREARATARIESEHVVRVSDVASMADGTPYMVMELLEGEDLRSLVAERDQLPVAEAVGYVLQACEGLATAHAAGVIHRDLKPSNLFLAKRPNGTRVLKVLDFGISKLAPRAGEAAFTTTSSLMGSPLYMAPEQMRSSRDVDERADVWSLGLILYELLAGDPPFYGETIPEICMAVMSGQPTPLSTYRNDVPAELHAIVLRCMAKDPSHRYASMGELARALEGFAGAQTKIHAERASAAVKSVRRILSVPPESGGAHEAVPRLAAVHRPVDSSPPVPLSARRPARGRPLWIPVAIGAMLAGALLTVVVARMHRATPAPVASPPPVTATQAPAAAPSVVPAPAATVTTVAFDSLPEVAPDAGSGRARALHPPTRASSSGVAPTVTAAPPAAPASTPRAAASSSDAWKWGDRQ